MAKLTGKQHTELTRIRNAFNELQIFVSAFLDENASLIWKTEDELKAAYDEGCKQLADEMEGYVKLLSTQTVVPVEPEV